MRLPRAALRCVRFSLLLLTSNKAQQAGWLCGGLRLAAVGPCVAQSAPGVYINGLAASTWLEGVTITEVGTVNGQTTTQTTARVSQTTNSTGAAITRTGSHLISKLQLLANDKDWDSAVTELRILAVSEAKGGTVSLTTSGDVLFTPDPNYTGVMGFKYQVADAQNNITQVSVGTGASAQTAAMKAAVFLASADLQDSQGRIDPQLVQQWYLADSNVLAAWKDYSGKGVRIGQFATGGGV